jgi:hypothetical protein
VLRIYVIDPANYPVASRIVSGLAWSLANVAFVLATFPYFVLGA